jgi:hypothetical protein
MRNIVSWAILALAIAPSGGAVNAQEKGAGGGQLRRTMEGDQRSLAFGGGILNPN